VNQFDLDVIRVQIREAKEHGSPIQLNYDEAATLLDAFETLARVTAERQTYQPGDKIFVQMALRWWGGETANGTRTASVEITDVYGDEHAMHVSIGDVLAIIPVEGETEAREQLNEGAS
jgi:hypothetical protein